MRPVNLRGRQSVEKPVDLTGPQSARRGRRVGIGAEFSPPLTHVGGIEGGVLGPGVGAGVEDQEPSCVGPAAGKPEGHGEHYRIGGLAAYALPDGVVIALGCCPEASGGGVCGSRTRVDLSGAPPRESAQDRRRPTRPNMIDELGPGAGPVRVLIPRGSIQDEGAVLTTVVNVIVPVGPGVRDHALRGIQSLGAGPFVPVRRNGCSLVSKPAGERSRFSPMDLQQSRPVHI
jgi:hypothetical protein